MGCQHLPLHLLEDPMTFCHPSPPQCVLVLLELHLLFLENWPWQVGPPGHGAVQGDGGAGSTPNRLRTEALGLLSGHSWPACEHSGPHLFTGAQ